MESVTPILDPYSANELVILGGDFNVSSIEQSRLDDLLTCDRVKPVLEAEGAGSISESANGYRQLLS